MIFTETKFKGVYVIEIEKFEDNRGFFSRLWCQKEFSERGLNTNFLQGNLAHNHKKATIRGLHYQTEPYQEVKLVRCTRGALYDVIIDLRPESETYLQWFAITLSDDDYKQLYIPEGFAHGYQTLTDNVEMRYGVTQFYAPEAERGIRWDDPLFKINWPYKENLIISAKDRNWPNFVPQLTSEKK